MDHRRRAERHRARRPAHSEGASVPAPCQHRATRTSTPRRSTAGASCGSRGRAGSTGASIRRSERCASSPRRAAKGRTGSRQRLRATSTTRRSPARISVGSTCEPDGRPCSARQRLDRGRVVRGPTRAAGSGSASGTRARSACTTRARSAGASGACPGTNPMIYAVYVDERDKVWLTRLRRERARGASIRHRDGSRGRAPEPGCRRAPAPRPTGRGLGRRVRHRQARRRPDALRREGQPARHYAATFRQSGASFPR